MSEMALRVARAIDTVLVRVGIGFVDEKTSAAISRAVIEAMREPTEAMVAAGNKLTDWASGADDAWQAMIDEALK